MIAVLKGGSEESYGDDVKLELIFGAVYRFKGIRGPDRDGKPCWAFVPCEVRLLGIARNVHSEQDSVIYTVLSGPQEGNMIACTLSAWANNFEAPLEPEPDPAPPEKVMNFKSGSGY